MWVRKVNELLKEDAGKLFFDMSKKPHSVGDDANMNWRYRK